MDKGKEKVSDRYDRWTPFYDFVDNIPVVSRPQRKWKRRAVNNLNLSDGDRILDVGTGTGQILPWIANSLDEGKIVGTDISRSMIKYTKKKVEPSNGVDLEVMYDDIEDSRFSDDYFDKIISTFTFTTIPDVEKASNECARILKSEGEMIVLDTGKPKNPYAKPLFYPMMMSAKLFGRTHMDRDIVDTISQIFNVKKIEDNMLGMVYLIKCRIT